SEAPKISPSMGFVAVAAPEQEAINKLDASKAAAVEQARSQVGQAFAAISREDDRYMAGSLAVNLGGKTKDPDLQRKGVEAMIASGKSDAETMQRLLPAAGQLAFQAKVYAAAQRYLKSPIDGGAADPELMALLPDTYI